MKGRAAAVVLAIWFSAVAAVAAWGVSSRPPSVLESQQRGSAETTLIPVATFVTNQQVRISVDVSGKGRDILVAPSSGIVTRTGDLSSAVPLDLNDSGLVLLETPFPLWRTITQGLSGKDVEALQQILLEQGLLDGEPDGRSGSLTMAAAAQYRVSLGLDRLGQFGPGNTLWVAPDARLGDFQWFVAVGDRVDIGDELARGPVVRGTVDVRSTDDVPLPFSSESSVVIEINGTEVRWRAGDRLTVEDLPLSESTEDETLQGIAYLESSIEVVQVPRSSVVGLDADGQACVFDENGRALEVNVVETILGVSTIEWLAQSAPEVMLDAPGSDCNA